MDDFDKVYKEFLNPPQKDFIEVGDLFMCRLHKTREKITSVEIDVVIECGLQVPIDLLRWDPEWLAWFAVPVFWHRYYEMRDSKKLE